MTRILLITDVAPSPDFTAGIVLEQILKYMPENIEVSCFTFKNDNLPNYSLSKKLLAHSSYVTRKPNEDWNKMLFGRAASNIGEKFASKESIAITSEILRIASYSRFDHILVVIQGQTSIRVFNSLIANGLSASTLHWDMWDWWESANKVPRSFRRQVQLMLQNIKNQGVHIFPSHEFAERMEITSDSSLTLYPCMTERFVGNDLEPVLLQSQPIDIVFLGQHYAEKEIQLFLAFMQEISWKIGDRKFRLHAFGSRLNTSDPNVINHGWVNYERLPSLISKYHIAFMPYPRDESFKVIVETSFPSKLISYISAGLPILAFGPKEFSAKNLINRIGCNVTSHDVTEFLQCVEQILANYPELKKETENVYNEKFSPTAFSAVIESWLNRTGLGPVINPSYTLSRDLDARVQDLEFVRAGPRLSINFRRMFKIKDRLKFFVRAILYFTRIYKRVIDISNIILFIIHLESRSYFSKHRQGKF